MIYRPALVYVCLCVCKDKCVIGVSSLVDVCVCMSTSTFLPLVTVPRSLRSNDSSSSWLFIQPNSLVHTCTFERKTKRFCACIYNHRWKVTHRTSKSCQCVLNISVLCMKRSHLAGVLSGTGFLPTDFAVLIHVKCIGFCFNDTLICSYLWFPLSFNVFVIFELGVHM